MYTSLFLICSEYPHLAIVLNTLNCSNYLFYECFLCANLNLSSIVQDCLFFLSAFVSILHLC